MSKLCGIHITLLLWIPSESKLLQILMSDWLPLQKIRKLYCYLYTNNIEEFLKGRLPVFCYCTMVFLPYITFLLFIQSHNSIITWPASAQYLSFSSQKPPQGQMLPVSKGSMTWRRNPQMDLSHFLDKVSLAQENHMIFWLWHNKMCVEKYAPESTLHQGLLAAT